MKARAWGTCCSRTYHSCSASVNRNVDHLSSRSPLPSPGHPRSSPTSTRDRHTEYPACLSLALSRPGLGDTRAFKLGDLARPLKTAAPTGSPPGSCEASPGLPRDQQSQIGIRNPRKAHSLTCGSLQVGSVAVRSDTLASRGTVCELKDSFSRALFATIPKEGNASMTEENRGGSSAMVPATSQAMVSGSATADSSAS